jgi:hypothetical protein
MLWFLIAVRIFYFKDMQPQAILFGGLRVAVASEIPLSRPSAFPLQYISFIAKHLCAILPNALMHML